MTNTQVVSIVFRLINFGILIGLFTYIFKKKIFGLITQAMAAYKEHIDSLQKRQKELHVQQERIVDGIKSDSTACQQLREKVDSWRASAQAERIANDEQRKHRIGLLHERARMCAERIAQYRMQQKVAPYAAQKAGIKTTSDKAKLMASYLSPVVK